MLLGARGCFSVEANEKTSFIQQQELSNPFQQQPANGSRTDVI